MRRPNLTSCLAVMVFLLALPSATAAGVIYIDADATGADNAGGANGDTAVTVTASALKDIYALGEQVPLVVTIVNYSAQPVYIYVDKDGFLRQTITVKDMDGVTITGEPVGTPPPPPRSYWVEIDGEKVFVVPVKEIEPGQTVTAVIADALRGYHGHLQEGIYYLTPRDMSVIHDVGFVMERDDVPQPLWIDPSTVISKAKYKVNTVQIWLRRAVIYVDADASGANDGSSWADAYNYLQDGLADANSSEKPVEIRVAQGIYKPDQGANQSPGDRQATFQLINGVTIKGGFAGFSEPDPNARDISRYETILSGDLDGNDVTVDDPCDRVREPSRVENTFHVVTGSGTDRTAVLDGFTITGGNASGSWTRTQVSNEEVYNYGEDPSPQIPPPLYHTEGGGMYNQNGSPTVISCAFTENSARDEGGGICNKSNSNPTMSNCTFSGNLGYFGGGLCGGNGPITSCTFVRNSAEWGGGMANVDQPMLTDCVFSGNSADRDGGAMYNHHSNSIMTNCTFRGNSAGWSGGGIYNHNGSLRITNCVLIGNSASKGGGAVHNRNSNSNTKPAVINCTFATNSAPNGDALACDSYLHEYPSKVQVTSCILWDGGNEIWNNDGSTITVIYSDVCGGWPGEGNIDSDPCFAEPGHWDPNGTPHISIDDFWVDGDYHLKSQAGRWDPSSQSWVQDNVTSPCIDVGDMSSPIGYEAFPNGGIINMGAYGGTAEASKSYFGQPICEAIVAGDVNGDCVVNLRDFTLMSFHWLEDNTLLPPPLPPPSPPRR